MLMRFAACVEYDGAGFFGWQRQAEGRTVQACVEQAISKVADHSIKVICAGRTDTGVHATGQVIHFDTQVERPTINWLRGTNANLPDDISVQWLTGMDDSFHARFSATQRYYRYVIYNHASRPALLRNHVCWQHRELDAGTMDLAGKYLLGEHDFTSFRAAACQARSPVRTIHSLEVTRSGHFIYIDVIANAFLHHMVRCIAGVLMKIGCGDQPPLWVSELLQVRDRRVSGINASPAGLYLIEIRYPGHFKVPSRTRLPVFG
jgi:tRNA pseudouridine38-40 synthase